MFFFWQVNPSKNHQTKTSHCWHPTNFVQDFGPPKNASKPPTVHWALPLEVPPELMLSAAKHVASTAVVIVLPVPGGPWFWNEFWASPNGVSPWACQNKCYSKMDPGVVDSTWKNTENSNHVRKRPTSTGSSKWNTRVYIYIVPV